MAKKTYTHIHRYERLILGRNGYTVFRCIKPGCNHYIRKELAKGKLAECNRCGEPFVLNQHSIGLQKPHCENCIEKRSGSVIMRKLG